MRVFHTIIKNNNNNYTNIPTLFGGISLSSVVPLLLDKTIPIGLIDAQAELTAEAFALNSTIGYINADGERHLVGGSDPAFFWYKQIAPSDIYIPL
jgi:hypothetical protein